MLRLKLGLWFEWERSDISVIVFRCLVKLSFRENRYGDLIRSESHGGGEGGGTAEKAGRM